MKRVGNKPAQLVRSASRRKKAANRFQFDLTVESVTGLRSGSTHYIKWMRGVKVASSSQFETPKDVPVSGTPVGEKLSLLVTLYREEGKKFDVKEAKLSLVAVNPSKKQERTSAKARFDLSQYAGVPSATHTKTIKLSDRVSVHVKIESRFLKAGASGPGSAFSSMDGDGVSMRSSDDGGDDFDDLVIDDVPEPVSAPSSSKSVTSTVTNSASTTSSSLTKDSSTNSTNHAAATTTTASTATSSSVRQPKSLASSSSTVSSAPLTASPQTKSNGTSTAPSVSKVSSSSRMLSREKADDSSISSNDAAKSTNGDKERVISGLQQLARDKERALKELKDENSKLSSRVLEAERRRESDENSLRRENDRLSASLKEAQRARSSSNMSNKLHVDSLMSRLDDRASQLEDAVSERDQAKKMIQVAKDERDSARLELEVTRRELYVAKEDAKQITRLTAQRDESLLTNKETRSELAIARRDLEEYRLRSKRLEGAEARCAELSKEVDRLTVAAAANEQGNRDLNGANSQENGGMSSEVQKRLAALQEEKESLMRKLRSHESHGAKVKATYEELSGMYTQLRMDHTALQKEAAEARKSAREARASTEAGMVRKEEMDTLRRVVAELEASKEALQGEIDKLRGEGETLKDRLDSTAQTLAQTQQEVTDTQQEKEEMKRQRDVAMQRALSRGKSQTPGPEVDQLRVDKEAAEQERDRLAQTMEQLRKDMGDLKDDVEYERTEKTKAREERDKIRENARTLERRTSQALRTTDALHSLKRELSSSQMRVQDYESMVTELKSDNDALRRQLEEQQPSPRSLEATASAKDDEMTQMVNELVEAKMAVAQAMAERQQLEFELQQMRKEERAMQQRLATKASRLEVRLESANQEIERLRSYGGGTSGSGSTMGRRHSTAVPKSHDAREFNELGSDVDY